MEYSETIPIQYQEGKARFMDMDIMVDPRVLIPRPETELLVEIVAGICMIKKRKEPFILELGTGSGIIPIALTKLIKDCKVIGSDICEEALSVARSNLEKFDSEDRVELVASDMFEVFAAIGYREAFDCIVSNPPYVSQKDYEKLDAWVRAEPKKALYAGVEGMDYLNIISAQSMRFLRPGGFVAVEIGYDQAEKVKKSFSEAGFEDITGYKDFNEFERVIVGWKHG